MSTGELHERISAPHALWPGQSQTITQTYTASRLRGKDPVVSISGFNVDTVTIAGNSSCVAQSGVEDFGSANGQVASANAAPGQANTPETMAALKEQVTVAQ
jgi:exo-1,4-beta-D-glucosaminidase